MIPVWLVGLWANRTIRTVAYVILSLSALLAGIRCYGDRRAEAAQREVRVAIADSVAAIVRQEARLITDSALAAMQRAELRADSAIERARRAESAALAAQTAASEAAARYSRLPPTMVSSLPPEVAAVLRDLESSNRALLESNAELVATNRALVMSNDSLRAGAALQARAFVAKDSAYAALERVVIELRGLQPKQPSRLKRWASTGLKLAIGAGIGYAAAQAR